MTATPSMQNLRGLSGPWSSPCSSAPSGAPSLNSKRKTVEDFAREALGLDPEEDRSSIYPLTPQLVEEVAAALKEADYRGAEQCLGEFR